MAEGTLLRTLEGHGDQVMDVAFTADGRVISAANDNTVRLWSVDDGRPPIVLSQHGAGLSAILVLPTGGRAVSAARDGSLELWRLDLLLADHEILRERLDSVTIYCLSIAERVVELGEDALEADQARRRCVESRR